MRQLSREESLLRMEKDDSMDSQQVAEFKEAFELFDDKKKGSLDKNDLRACFKKYGSLF